MNRIRGIILIGIIIFTTYSFINTFVENTSSYFTSSVLSKNEYSSDDIKIHITKNDLVNQEKNNYHEFIIKNESKSDALLRASINPMWVDNEGNILLDDISFIKFIVRTNISDDESYINSNNGYELLENYESINKLWVDGDDGYYYLDKKLCKNEGTSLFIQLYLDEEFEQIKHLYENKSLILDINAEALQCTEDAYKQSWSNINSHIEEILKSICKY